MIRQYGVDVRLVLLLLMLVEMGHACLMLLLWGWGRGLVVGHPSPNNAPAGQRLGVAVKGIHNFVVRGMQAGGRPSPIWLVRREDHPSVGRLLNAAAKGKSSASPWRFSKDP